MGRRNRRKDRDAPLRPIGSVSAPEDHPDGQWHVRRVTGAAAVKTYRCPGCEQEIRPGTAHVVAWRADLPHADEDRRHWHSPCWQSRTRRRPTR
jgi:hypothetical protein